MVDAGGPGSVRKCPGAALADLGDVKGFDRSGEEDQLYAFQLSDGVYKRKKFTPSEGIRSLKFEELSDGDISHAVPKRLYSLAFTGDKWVAFADPVQQTGWSIDLKIASPYVVTGKEHKLRKVVNSATRLCSFIPETRIIIVSKAPDQKLGTANGGVLRWSPNSSPPPASIIGLGLSVTTILLEIVLGDEPGDFVDVLSGFKLKWPQKHANQGVGIRIIVQETPSGAVHACRCSGEADFHLLNLDKLFSDPVSLKRLRFTPGELSFDQTTVIIGQ